MPEIRFQIQWPDGSQETCYSPSLVVKDYFTPNSDYDLDDFVQRSRTALKIASDRVQAKYGSPCGLALGQLQEIEIKSAQYSHLSQPKVQFIHFIEWIQPNAAIILKAPYCKAFIIDLTPSDSLDITGPCWKAIAQHPAYYKLKAEMEQHLSLWN